MNHLRWISALLPASAAALLGLGLLTSTGSAKDSAKDDAHAKPAAEDEAKSPFAKTLAMEGKDAPDFTLKTVDGKELKLSDLKKNVVVLDFWATWCPPCRLSLPHVEEVSKNKEFADKGLKVIAVDDAEANDKVQEFLKQNKYTFTVAMDTDEAVKKQFKVVGIPSTFVIGQGGKIKKVFVGFDPKVSPKALDAAIEEALKEADKSAKAE